MLTFELGEAFQFDWSEEGLVVGGIYRRMQVSHMKLCASRAFWLVAYPGQGHEMLFDAHRRLLTRPTPELNLLRESMLSAAGLGVWVSADFWAFDSMRRGPIPQALPSRSSP